MILPVTSTFKSDFIICKTPSGHQVESVPTQLPVNFSFSFSYPRSATIEVYQAKNMVFL